MNAIISQIDSKLEAIQEVLKELNLPHGSKEACFQSLAHSQFDIKEYFGGDTWTLQSNAQHTKTIKTLLKHQSELLTLVFDTTQNFLICFDEERQIPDFFNTYLQCDQFKTTKEVLHFLETNKIIAHVIKSKPKQPYATLCLNNYNTGCDGVLATKIISEIQDAFSYNPLNRFPYMTKDGEVFATPGY